MKVVLDDLGYLEYAFSLKSDKIWL